MWNDSDIDVENWVMEAPASDHEVQLLAIRSYFEIEPRTGHLEPGQTAFVHLSYTADVEGRHVSLAFCKSRTVELCTFISEAKRSTRGRRESWFTNPTRSS